MSTAPSQRVASGRYLWDIAALRDAGGDVIPSLGGWSADQAGTEIADSCTSVPQSGHGRRGPPADHHGRHQRDHGACPGSGGSTACYGMLENRSDVSPTLAPLTA